MLGFTRLLKNPCFMLHLNRSINEKKCNASEGIYKVDH